MYIKRLIILGFALFGLVTAGHGEQVVIPTDDQPTQSQNIDHPRIDIDTANYNALVYVEMNLLKKYFLENDLEALKDYLALYQSAHKEVLKAAAENHIHLLDDYRGGIQFYHEWKNSKLSAAEGYAELLHDNKNFDACFAPFKANLMDMLYCGTFYFAAFKNIVTGSALDNLNVTDWEKTAELQQKSPEELLQHYYPMEKEEILKRTSDVEKSYSYDEIMRSMISDQAK